MKENARVPLIAMVWTSILGITTGAFRTSSLMCTAPSKPGGKSASSDGTETRPYP
jgi:hypothetical protein